MGIFANFNELSLCLFFSLFINISDAGRMYIVTTCRPPLGDVCIEARKCPKFDDLLNRSPIPRPRSVIREIIKHQCGFVPNTPKVCCFSNTLTTTRPPPPPPPPSTMYLPPTEVTTTNEHIRFIHKVDEDMPYPTNAPRMEVMKDIPDNRESDEIMYHKNFKMLPNDICGTIPVNYRITYGTDTFVGEFPWMALIAYSDADGKIDFRCAGTLITDRHVLTAAHCIINTTIVGVRLGEHNLDTLKDCDPETNACMPEAQDFFVEKVIVHPDYNYKNYMNDIALLKLATSANFNAVNIQPVCLPLGDATKNNLIGKFAIVSGWGVTETGTKSSVLMKVAIPVVPLKECQKIYRSLAAITSKQMCAGGQSGKDTCGGDSGGPLKYVGIIDGTPRYIQYGIVSYGPRHCGADGQPGIYTSVSNYITWILDNI